GAGLGVDVELPDDVREWLATVDPASWQPLAPQGVRALDGVLEQSELRTLWDETRDDSWAAGTRALRDALAAPAPGPGARGLSCRAAHSRSNAWTNACGRFPRN